MHFSLPIHSTGHFKFAPALTRNRDSGPGADLRDSDAAPATFQAAARLTALLATLAAAPTPRTVTQVAPEA